MTTLRGKTPTPTQFANAHRDRFAQAIRDAAGSDGRITLAEAKRIAQREGPEWLISDNAVDILERSGQKTISANKLIGKIHEHAHASAASVAGSNQKMSLLEARSLPATLEGDFAYLRGVGVPDRVEPADIKAWALVAVTAALDNESATRLSSAPWQVRGKRPIIEYIPHPTTSTHARVYVANDEVYFARAAPRGPGQPLVGWYHVGKLPPELRGDGG